MILSAKIMWCFSASGGGGASPTEPHRPHQGDATGPSRLLILDPPLVSSGTRLKGTYFSFRSSSKVMIPQCSALCLRTVCTMNRRINQRSVQPKRVCLSAITLFTSFSFVDYRSRLSSLSLDWCHTQSTARDDTRIARNCQLPTCSLKLG